MKCYSTLQPSFVPQIGCCGQNIVDIAFVMYNLKIKFVVASKT